MSKIYIATGNPSKLTNFKKLFRKINSKLIVEMVPEKLETEENGQTIAENSLIKVMPYYGQYTYPVIANDFGLEFDKKVTELQDMTKAKRVALKDLDSSRMSQAEIGKVILNFYKDIARKYGGEIQCTAHDIFTAIFPDGSTKQSHAVRTYILCDREIVDFDIYHPLNSLRISPKINKFIDEFSSEDQDRDFQPLVEALRQLIDNSLKNT